MTIPAPPDWTVDWPALEVAWPVLAELRGCAQDPVHHGEGDVHVHTQRTVEALANLDAFRALPAEDRTAVFLGALLHDVSKPARTSIHKDGSVSSRGHSRLGELRVRELLWRAGVDPLLRERVCALVRHHMIPFFLVGRADAERIALSVSQRVRCADVALVAQADALGRECPDRGELLSAIALFREFCAESDCLDRPFAFPSDHTRFVYFRSTDRSPRVEIYDDSRCEAIVLSGLPGAGKSRWIEENAADLPLVSLDLIRAELGVDPADAQGAVVSHARELARERLRRGEPFVWNATNVSSRLRAQVVDLCSDYGARTRIVYVEAPVDRLFAQNRARAKPVPEPVIEGLLKRWEVPTPTEAHQVDWVF